MAGEHVCRLSQMNQGWAEGRVSESGRLVGRVVSPIGAGDINTVWKVKEQPRNSQSKSQSLQHHQRESQEGNQPLTLIPSP